jgi:exonuclease III
MHNIKKLKIMSWNSQSIRLKIPELSFFADINKVDIILIQETWLNEASYIKLPGYTCYRSDRVSLTINCHGGVAIFIKKSITHTNVKSHKLKYIENIFIDVPFKNSTLTIGSVYASPSINILDFRSDFASILSTSGPVIIAGDFNAKHSAWNNDKSCYRGRELLRLLDGNHFDIYSPNQPTLYPCRGKPSIVDFVISKNVHAISKPNSHNDLSSDHIPILFELNSNFDHKDTKTFDFNKANWTLFRHSLDSKLVNISNNITLSSKNLIDSTIEKLNNAILSSADEAIPKKRPYSFRYPFSEEIQNLKRYRNFYRKRYKETHDSAFKSCYNQLNRLIRNATLNLNRFKSLK